jgi:hypothetical protein
MSDDILDSVLNLEEASYQAGFEQGKADGLEVGFREGKLFGVEKGYLKAVEMGKLYGRALVLNACLSDPNPIGEDPVDPSQFETASSTGSESMFSNMPSLPTIPENPRLKKHVETLLKLTDPHTLSLENTDEAVAEFDDRMKKATAKAKVIDKLIAEPYHMSISGEATASNSQSSARSGNIEELSNPAARR